MTILLPAFRATIASRHMLEPTSPDLLIERSGNLACHYAPFDYVNRTAKVVLLGMTPGSQQARNALSSLRTQIHAGHGDDDALRQAKEVASFSGPMRSNLVAMLDHVGLHRTLGVQSCADLFTHRADLVHFTSTLRYPVFLDGKDYSGSPSILATPFLESLCERWLTEEIALLSDAYWIPLGKEATAVLRDAVARGRLDAGRVLDGLPHPSGANAERIAYFLGTKSREALSSKTDPDKLAAARTRLIARINNPGQVQSAPAASSSTNPGPASPSSIAGHSTSKQHGYENKPMQHSASDTPHLLDVWALDKDGQKVHPYKGKSGAKKGLYSVNFTNETKGFQGMTEAALIHAIQAGRLRHRGTIRMCRVTASSGSNAFAPLMFRGRRVKEL